MSPVKLYLRPTLLLLVLSCSLWQISYSLPNRSKGLMKDSCVSYAHTLLQNISGALTQSHLFSGIDCSKQTVELNMETNTPSVCAPKGSSCSGISKSEFDQESCLENIGMDLQHYYTFLASQPDPNDVLGPTILVSLREFMENCFAWSLSTDLALNQAAVNRPSTYDERLSLCKVLQGFQLRTITINRAIGYMCSGEHTKTDLQ